MTNHMIQRKSFVRNYFDLILIKCLLVFQTSLCVP